MSKNYFEIVYQGPLKGVDTSLPEDCIPLNASPFMNNFTLKNGEIRTRPVQDTIFPPTPDGNPMLGLQSFLDQNNVTHTCAVTSKGLWQVNRKWNIGKPSPQKTWQLVGSFLAQPGPNFPASMQVFVDKLFWTNAGNHLWMWDGIGSVGAPRVWGKSVNFRQGDTLVDSNNNLQVANNSGLTGAVVPVWSNVLGGQTADNTINWTESGAFIKSNAFVEAGVVDATNGFTAGAYFLIELNAQLIMLSTVESTGVFPQRIRWSPSGLPTVWDPKVNIGAGFNDELDVPDVITGGFTVGTTAFILRSNGITEMTSNGSAINPWNFNHLWASKRGIGNALPFGFASYGPIGIFISSDDIYSVSMGGFKRIGGVARDSIYRDIGRATVNPIGSIVPYYSGTYIYNHYRLSIPIGNDTITWVYSIEDESWQKETKKNNIYTAQTQWVFVN